jgi:hypothetical protein
VHSSDATGLKKVIIPFVCGSHVVKDDWIRDNGMRSKYFGSGIVFVKGQASAECADTRKPGGNELMAKISEVIAHFIIRLFAFGVKGEGCWWLDVDEEHGAQFVLRIEELDHKRRDGVERIAPNRVGDAILRRDYERTIKAEKMEEESIVGARVDVFV